MQLLHLDSSILGTNSVSRRLSAEIVARQVALHPRIRVVYRDLASDPALHLSGSHLAAWQGNANNDAALGADLAKGNEIVGVYQHRDILVELLNEETVKNCVPDFSLMKKSIDKIIITAPGKSVDFVSRFFAPGAGVDEDPVTGSAHSQLIPFWSEKLNKNKMQALQLSKRGGEIWCEQLNIDRVTISGNCVFYMKGEIEF